MRGPAYEPSPQVKPVVYPPPGLKGVFGRALLDTLLSSRREQRAALTVRPVATDAKEFSEHLGWQR